MERNIQSNYEWIQRGKPRLLITIGESWTWGDSLGEQRLGKVYGCQLANRLDADWLNIACCGESNLWIADHYVDVCDQIPTWDYKHVDIVLTLTEIGREFNGNRDQKRVYTELLKDVKTFDQFLDTLSELIAQRIRPGLDRYPTWIGTNFIDSNYNLPLVDRSWLDLIADSTKQKKHQDRTLVVGSWVYERFDAVFEFNPTIERSAWRNSVLKHMDRASHTTELLMASSLNYKQASKHPTPEGHKLWADYLYQKIIS